MGVNRSALRTWAISSALSERVPSGLGSPLEGERGLRDQARRNPDACYRYIVVPRDGGRVVPAGRFALQASAWYTLIQPSANAQAQPAR